MRLNSKGQVTIPAALRRAYGYREGDEVEVIDNNGTLTIIRSTGARTAGERFVRNIRGVAGAGPTTDELMELLRG